MINSIWANSSEMPSFPSLDGDKKTDVLIIGGGMAGLLCAREMEKLGADYLLIEADEICRGVSRNTTAKLTSQHGLIYDKLTREFGLEKARMYLEANRAAIERCRSLAEKIPCDFENEDAYVYCTDNDEKLEKEMDALDKIGAKAEYVNSIPLPFPVAGAIRFGRQAQFHPLKFAAGIAQNLNIAEHTRALAFEANRVITNRGKISASNIIVATHFPILNKHGAYFIKMYQHRSYVLALKNTPKPDGMYIDGSEKGLSFRTCGDLLLLGGGSHRTGKKGGNWAELERFAEKNYHDFEEVCRWAAQDCMTLDGVPYIGRYGKNTPNLFVATGFNKWGMSSSMVSAMILADAVQGKTNPYAAVFAPSRTVFRPQLFVNTFEAVANLLTPTAPRCPHLGCALKWNPSEHSWDCPCHGSRFTKNGKLMDNPSNGNLKL